MTTIGEARKEAISVLKKSRATATCMLDTDVLFSHILKKEKAFLISHRDERVSFFTLQKLKRAVAKRSRGIPVAYITQRKEFFALDFFVNRNVLIPKPDTELLVEVACNFLKEKLSNNEKKKAQFLSENERKACADFFGANEIKILDLCTGSGCVGIALSKNILALFPEKKIALTLSDISSGALSVAKKNVKSLLFDFLKEKKISADFARSDLFSKLGDKRFHLIVSNPPYVPTDEACELLKDGRGEPLSALDGKSSDGFAILEKIITSAHDHLFAGGALALESGEYNACKTQRALCRHHFSHVRLFYDLAKMPRVSLGITENQRKR